MKPHELSKKSNPWGDVMNLSEAFNQLKKQKHDDSFENLGDWLDQNHTNSKSRKMKSIYKIAASFIFLALIFVACSIPVEQEEEIGYMIKGLASAETIHQKAKLSGLSEIDPAEVSMNQVLHEEIGKGDVAKLTEIVVLLPEANRQAALSKKAALSGLFDFQSLEILPIEDKVKRTLFESALHTFDLQLREGLDEARVTERINTFLHENSASPGKANIQTDPEGNKYVEIEVELSGINPGDTKRSIEQLHNDLSPDVNFTEKEIDIEKKEKLELKLRKLKEENK